MGSKRLWLGMTILAGALAHAGGLAHASGPAPVEAAFVRIDAKREVMVYTVMVKDADIEQVDLEFHYLDAAKKELSKGGLAWQNNVKGKLQPIEKGKTYEDSDPSSPDGTADCKIEVVRVHYKGGKKWTK